MSLRRPRSSISSIIPASPCRRISVPRHGRHRTGSESRSRRRLSRHWARPRVMEETKRRFQAMSMLAGGAGQQRALQADTGARSTSGEPEVDAATGQRLSGIFTLNEIHHGDSPTVQGLPTPAGHAPQVAARPYDVLSSEEARVEAAGNPLSFLHIGKPEIDLPPDMHIYDERVYQKGKENLRKLIADGIPERRPEALPLSLCPDDGDHTQYGIVGLRLGPGIPEQHDQET